MISGVTYHPRSEWVQAKYPVTGPRQIAGNITRPAAHYTAAVNLPDGDLGEFEYNIPPYLAAIQRDYVNNRGYSIGYLFAIDWLGGVWELRGFDYKAAATYMHNEYTAPILFLVDGADQATPLACRAARVVWREFRRRANRSDFADRPWGHGEFKINTGIGTPTACPGAGVLVQLHRGDMDLDIDPVEGWNMRPHSERVLDTRNTQRLAARAVLTVPVGMATEAIVKVSAIRADSAGWLSLDGGATTVCDWGPEADGDDGVAYVALESGAITIKAGPSACDVIVDVQGLG